MLADLKEHLFINDSSSSDLDIDMDMYVKRPVQPMPNSQPSLQTNTGSKVAIRKPRSTTSRRNKNKEEEPVVKRKRGRPCKIRNTTS